MDLVAFDDLSTFGEETTSPIQELEQDLYHRLIETPGSNLDDPNRGLGIEDALSGPVSRGLGPSIEAEFRKDKRVLNVRAVVTQVTSGSNAGQEFRIEIDVECDEGELGMKLTFDALGLRRAS
jgi:hypothetical protein